MTALRAQLRRDKARLEGNGQSPCQESQHSIGATGAQPVDFLAFLVRAGRIGRITLLQRLDRPTSMLSPVRLVLRPIRHRRSREITNQRFPEFTVLFSVELMSRPGMSSLPDKNALRIDRWLFYCRFFKTRVLATAAVTGGHVKINGERTAPGSRVKVGDQIDLVRERLLFSLEVIDIPSRRGPAAEARRCYAEDERTVRQRESHSAALRQDRLLMPRTDGRPDKRTRRKLRARSRD